LVRDTLVLSGLATVVCCAGVLLWGDPRLALTIALGAVIASANFLLLARGVTRAIDRAAAGESSELARERGSEPGKANPVDTAGSDATHEPSRALVLEARDALQSGFRLALLLLAMLWILWYMPARPEGLAVGVLIVLVAATIAGLRHNRAI
jgi:hypothetical protein